MTRCVTITEARTHLCALLVDVERGEEVEISRRGMTVARITPTGRARDPRAPKDKFAGVVRTTDPNHNLYSTGERWNAS